MWKPPTARADAYVLAMGSFSPLLAALPNLFMNTGHGTLGWTPHY